MKLLTTVLLVLSVLLATHSVKATTDKELEHASLRGLQLVGEPGTETCCWTEAELDNYFKKYSMKGSYSCTNNNGNIWLTYKHKKKLTQFNVINNAMGPGGYWLSCRWVDGLQTYERQNFGATTGEAQDFQNNCVAFLEDHLPC